MAARMIPINAAVLRWAMSETGLNDREVAAASGVEFLRLRQILEGDKPSTKELRALAKLLNRPLSFFLLPEPPAAVVAQTSFRHPAGRAADRPLTADEARTLRDARRWQALVAGLRDSSPADRPTVRGTAAPAAAVEARSWLAWSLSDQLTAKSPSRVLALLRARLEDRGVLVVQYSLGRDNCRGFSLPDEQAPLVALNSTYTVEARIFTLLHEVAHLLRGDASVCGQPRDDRVERWCERFAASFLLPSDVVSQQLIAWFGDSKISEVAEVAKLARKYRVSLRAAALRIGELGRAEVGLYNRVDAESGDFDKPQFGNPNQEPQTTPVRRVQSLGEAIPMALIGAKDSGRLTEASVRRYLKVDGAQLESLSRRLQHEEADV